VVAGLAGCQSSAPGGHPGSDSIPALTADAAQAARLSAQEVSDANALYVVKCAKCHKFYDPADYSQKDWDVWMRKMSRKSKLKPAQDELLTRYLGAFREKHK
jgi:nitrate/TMAO reductase-like tetraheme cytochrome c subunit